MRKFALGILVLLILALWLWQASAAQQTVGPQEATVQAQLTAVVKPTPSAHR